MNFKTVLDAIVGAKTTIASLDKRISALQTEQQKLKWASPHREDLIAWAKRGLDEGADNFLQLLQAHWNETTLARYPGSDVCDGPGAQLLALNSIMPSPGHDTIWLSAFGATDYRRFTFGGSASAIVFFLRPAIEEQLPALIDRCFPSASKGVKHADRCKRLAANAMELEDLERQRDELRDTLAQAGQAAG
jgi:hypothetical protein